MHYRIGERVISADAEREGADGGAGVALLILSKKRPGERYWTLCVVRERFVADRAVVDGELEHHVELRQQRDDQFSAFPLLL